MKRLQLFVLLLPAFVYGQSRYDVIIDEIMADPTPSVGLPNNEWIELKNRSRQSINLQGWRLADGSGVNGGFPSYQLKPDSVVIVCTASAVASLSAYGSCVTVTSFPSLDNEGEMIYIQTPGGNIIHAVNYHSSWYRNELKKEGGWSLEMINTDYPCAGEENWIAGGTPGKKNYSDQTYIDNDPPYIINAYTTDSSTVILVFNEPISNYIIDADSIKLLSPLFNKIQFTTKTPCQTCTITAGVTDCSGNTSSVTVTTGRPGAIKENGLVINEILFNPRSGAFDYAEIYNKSDKIADASQLYLGIRRISNDPFYIFPGGYIVVTEDTNSLKRNYLAKNLLSVSLPSYPDDKGTVTLLNQSGEKIDEVNYDEDWHFKLLDNTEGISLERIDPFALSNDPQNWHSAASAAGYGTPGYRNSQYKNSTNANATIETSSKVFSPDNDGIDDILSIHYKLNEPGYVANITIYDAMGRPVKVLINNVIAGTSGYWNWDGLNDKHQPLPIGPYIIHTEIFNLQGRKKLFKNVVVLARRF